MRRKLVVCVALCAIASITSVGAANSADPSAAEQRRQSVEAPGASDLAHAGEDPRAAILAAGAEALLAAPTEDESGSTPSAVATTPEIIDPAEGSPASGVLALKALSSAPQVRFGFAGQVLTAPVVGGEAHAEVETWGVSGSQQVTAVDCDGVDCGSTADSVGVIVTNNPPTIGQPSDGADVGTSVAVLVSAPGGGIRILLDGATVAQVAGAPYQATVDTADLTRGVHTLGAVQCDTSFTSCAGRTAEDVTIHVVNELAPRVTDVSPRVFSPNGDGRRDTTTVRYDLDTRQAVTWRVLDRRGNTVRGPVRLGDESAGGHSLRLNGKDSHGVPLRSGAYRVRLTTSKDVGGTIVRGQAEAGFVIDTRAPRATDVRATPALFYPVRDHYRDTTQVRTRLTDDAAWLKAVIEDVKGRTVKVVALRQHDRGRHELTWNGRRSNGSVVRAGRYRLHFEAQDTAGNRSASGAVRLEVSDKRLRRHSATRTVLPRPSHIDTIIGGCSRAATPARQGWSGSIGYYSNWDICLYPTDRQLLSFTRHSITLPRAVRYGAVRVSTYGGRSVSGFPDKGVVLYENRRSDISDHGGLLRATTGWHRGQAVDGDDYVTPSHKFRWWGGTSNSWFYDIKQFRISYSWFTLE